MRTAKIAKLACVGLTLACALGLAACNGAGSNGGNSGGVAATVNGVEISEDTITKQVESVRAQMSVDDEDSWGQWLVQYGYTPESVREEIINGYVEQELIRQGAAERDITVDSSTIDEYVNSMKSQYDDDEAWESALEGAGMTEDEYRESLELSLLYTDLYAQFAPTEDPSEEDLVASCETYASMYDGAKRSSHILFDASDEATAQEVLDKINAGELDFAEAATEYSNDTGSAADGGDVGWDKLTSFVDEYQTALDGLEKDQVSGLVTSSFGIHIIKCTDVFNAPEEITSSDQIPEAFLDQIKKTLSSSQQRENYQAWLSEYKESADIVINDMPEGLPYDVDLTKYQTEDTATDSATSSTDESASGDSSSASASTGEGAETSGATESGDTSASNGSATTGESDTADGGATDGSAPVSASADSASNSK